MRYAVILAGGGGHRLWPASRRSRPKQFLSLGARAGESLLAATVRRIAAECPPARTVVVTAAAQAARVREEAPALPAGSVLVEPVGRNTAAAIGLAAVHLLHRDSDAILGILPADHHIADEARFAEVAGEAFALAERTGAIVTIGVVPTRPETGFGYLELGEPADGRARVVSRFVEKPDADSARRFLASGAFLWNGGMFFARARRLLDEIAEHLPATHAGLAAIADALRSGGPDAALRAAERVYPSLPAISIDHGVMERASRVLTLPGDFGWSDVGSWAALAGYRPADARGNITEGTVTLHDTDDSLVFADPGMAVAVIGVQGLVVVQSGNGVLVVPRERAQDVRAAVAALEARKLDDYL